MTTYTITKKNQVTIPPTIMSILGVQPGGKITYVVDQDKQVRVVDPLKAINQVQGSVTLPSRFKGKDIQEVIEQAIKEYFQNYRHI
jgi:bifunctional DNA-binding transcriptional regulator/antitoxin component of YhaV-PrlF toxin-antitoxin module